jgi:hypothetical protein
VGERNAKHGMLTLQFILVNARLFEDGVESSLWQVFAMHGDNGDFATVRMTEIVMTALDADKDKASLFQNSAKLLRGQ